MLTGSGRSTNEDGADSRYEGVLFELSREGRAKKVQKSTNPALPCIHSQVFSFHLSGGSGCSGCSVSDSLLTGLRWAGAGEVQKGMRRNLSGTSKKGWREPGLQTRCSP